jgi:hypothetical protein
VGEKGETTCERDREENQLRVSLCLCGSVGYLESLIYG